MLGGVGASANAAQVANLTQLRSLFIESENGMDNLFKTTNEADCEAIKTRTGAERLEKAESLTLKPGGYVFRVKKTRMFPTSRVLAAREEL